MSTFPRKNICDTFQLFFKLFVSTSWKSDANYLNAGGTKKENCKYPSPLNNHVNKYTRVHTRTWKRCTFLSVLFLLCVHSMRGINIDYSHRDKYWLPRSPLTIFVLLRPIWIASMTINDRERVSRINYSRPETETSKVSFKMRPLVRIDFHERTYDDAMQSAGL